MNDPHPTLTSDDVRDLLSSSPNYPKAKWSFLKGYHRVTVSEACRKIVVDNVDAWVGSGAVWKQLPAAEVNAIISQARDRDQSFCHTFLKENLGFSHAKYNDMKTQFDQVEEGNPVGIYEADVGNRVALVVDM